MADDYVPEEHDHYAEPTNDAETMAMLERSAAQLPAEEPF